MNLLNKIKKDTSLALKAGKKEKKIILSTLVGEIQRLEPEVVDGEKTWTDEQVIKTVKKMVESCSVEEIEIISVYLPKMMTTEELRSFISTYIVENKLSGMKDMGKVMGQLKPYTGQYDGKEASTIVKSLLV